MTNTDEIQTTPTNPASTSFWHRKPTLWVGGGLAAAALLVGGIGVGAAMGDDDGDDDDDRPIATQPVNNDSDDAPAAPVTGSYGVQDAGALTAILSSASNASNGTPTSMEAQRNGSWSVDFEAGNGDETTVLVTADGKASVVRTEAADGDDSNDAPPAGKLDDQSIAAAVKAALAEAQGSIIGIDLDDNANEAYSVQVLTGNNAETEIDLNTAFDVTKVDVDND